MLKRRLKKFRRRFIDHVKFLMLMRIVEIIVMLIHLQLMKVGAGFYVVLLLHQVGA